MNKVKLPKWEGSPLLPSAFQLGEYVHVAIGEDSFRFAHGNVLKHGKVIKVHFASGKVSYDLEFTVAIDNANKKRYTTRIHNVDGALCESVDPDNDPSFGEHTQKIQGLKTEESPFNHGGWHNADEIIFSVNENGISSDKLIDIDGNRKTFRVGWYASSERQWYFYHEENDQPIDQKNMKWTNLPPA